MVVGFSLPGLEGFLRFSRRLYLGVGVVVFLAQFRCGGVAVGRLAHGTARRGAQDRRILPYHLRACGRLFRLGFFLLLVVVLGVSALVAQGAGAVEGAFLVVQALDAFRKRGGAFRLRHTCLDDSASCRAAAMLQGAKGGSPERAGGNENRKTACLSGCFRRRRSLVGALRGILWQYSF